MSERETVESVTRWADESFGPATVRVQFERAKKEMAELEKFFQYSSRVWDEKTAEEAADVVICLYRIIGWLDPGAIEKKMAINRARKWVVDGEGCAQHVKEPGE